MSDANSATIEKLNNIKYKLNKYINLKEDNKVKIFRFNEPKLRS